jgi:hypothetical protein
MKAPTSIVTPADTWMITGESIKNVRDALWLIADRNWYPLRLCGKERMYLPGLESDPKFSGVKDQVKVIIKPFLESYLWKMYPKIINYKVQAIKLMGQRSQFQLAGGVYHRDYLPAVDLCVANE